MASVGNPDAGLVFTPPVTVFFLLRVRSAVVKGAVPHAVPGSSPILPMISSVVDPEFLESTTASSPLYQPDPLV